MKVMFTSEFMRIAVEKPMVYLGTSYTGFEACELNDRINWDVIRTAYRRPARARSFGLEFLKEDGRWSRLDKAHTAIVSFEVHGHTCYRVACLDPKTNKPWTYIYYLD